MKNKFMITLVFIIGLLTGSLIFPKTIDIVSAKGTSKYTKSSITDLIERASMSSEVRSIAYSEEAIAMIEYLKLENIESQTKILRSIEKHLKDAASSLKDITYKMN